MITRRSVAAAVLVCLCAAPAGRAALSAQRGAPSAPAAVARQPVDLPGAVEPHTPPEFNRALAFRYFLVGAPVPPSTVIVLIPGLNSGANTQDILARQLLRAHGPGLEVWVTSPRAVLLQDRRGVEAALGYQNPDFALGYYYGTLQIDDHRFHLLDGSEVPYMAYWGLDVHLRDIRATVRGVRGRYPTARVFLGGHSLGGILSAFYAGYDFAGTPGSPPTSPPLPPDIGGSDLAGLLFIDGLPVHIPVRLTPERYLHGFRVLFGPHIPGVDSLTDPDPKKRVAPFTKTTKLARTQDSILLDVLSAYALLRPREASYFPFYPRRGLKITNEALLAAVFSDEMQPDVLIRVNVEVPMGLFLRVPDPRIINPRGLLDVLHGEPAPGESLIRLPDRSPEPRPRVAIGELASAILRPGADFTEWYFPWRLLLDVGLSASLEPSDAFAQQYVHLSSARETTLPMLILGAGHGLVRSEGATRWYRSRVATPPDQITVKILRDFSHIDIEDADPNPIVPLILTWLRTVVH